ncbi:MAG: prepilin peptidase, partial [Proteobacteria bacterium]|nr:prepilin peptidase [Pseudomonadota bacterium]
MAFILVFAFLLGSAIGSFLNVCIYRLPLNISIILPPSHCPTCKRPIPFYDNIPILSYILLRGKCRSCNAPISFQYPFVEFLTGLVALALTLRFGLSLTTIIYFIFISALLVITFIDLKYQIIPDVISLPGIGIGLLASLVLPSISFLDSLLGILVGGGSLLIISYTYYFLTKREGMGLGDVKLLAMIGAFLGWQGALIGLITGAFVGTLAGVL